MAVETLAADVRGPEPELRFGLIHLFPFLKFVADHVTRVGRQALVH